MPMGAEVDVTHATASLPPASDISEKPHVIIIGNDTKQL